jgi:hypothetical protein
MVPPQQWNVHRVSTNQLLESQCVCKQNPDISVILSALQNNQVARWVHFKTAQEILVVFRLKSGILLLKKNHCLKRNVLKEPFKAKRSNHHVTPQGPVITSTQRVHPMTLHVP